MDGLLPGVPAVTRHERGPGTAWYVATRLDDKGTEGLVRCLLNEAGVEPVTQSQPGVEVVRRSGSGRSHLFVLNHTAHDATVDAHGEELLADRRCAGRLVVPAGTVAVVRQTG